MLYLYMKAIHISFMVTWFAGLFYMVRLFIYYAEAQTKPTADKSVLIPQYIIMMKRLWYMITWPGMILTLIFGIILIYLNSTLLLTFWFWVKLILLAGLFTYHGYSHYLFLQCLKHKLKMSSEHLRFYNEIATLFLFAIVLLAILKNTLSMLEGFVFLIALGILLAVLIRLYRKYRQYRNN